MEIITASQRFTEGQECAAWPCARCAGAHADKILDRISRNEPVRFLLPAFPGKSPNTQKVFGALPDKAEALALEFLDETCQRVKAIYPAGAVIIICSDGRVFSDLVGIRDEDISAYQHKLRELASGIGPDTLELYHLDDVYPELAHEDMRGTLTTRYGEELDTLKDRISQGGEPMSLYRGITRFLFEDSDRADQRGSRAARQRESRSRAYVVIQRSNAWGELVRRRFPDAVRLSIHPQACGAEKLGISLMDAMDNWLTPWHGVAVDVDGHFLLMKRYQAETYDAELVYDGERPSHFRIKDPNILAEFAQTPKEAHRARKVA